MKKLYIASALLSLVLGAASCSQEYNLYNDETASVVMLKVNGEQKMNVYSTDDLCVYTVRVLKGGHDRENGSSATVRVMTNEEFAAYCKASGKPYKAIPAECFSFNEDGSASTAATLTFAGDEIYKAANVYFKTAEFKKWIDAFNAPGGGAVEDGVTYSPVLPIIIESADASISEDNDQLFLVPQYVQPTIKFDDGGGLQQLERKGDTFTCPLSLPVDNRWDIEVEVAMDADYVAEYNKANKTSFTCVSPDAITGLQSVYSLKKGTKSVNIEYTIDKTKCKFSDVVPLVIKSINIAGIGIDAEASKLLTELKRELVFTSGSFVSNALEPTEGSYANLCDGSAATFFHSAWSVTVSDNHNLTVTLPEAVTILQVEWWNRANATTNAPAEFNFYAGPNSESLTLVKAFNANSTEYVSATEKLNSGNGAKNTLKPMQFESPVKVFRIENIKSSNNNKFFVLSELKAYTI